VKSLYVQLAAGSPLYHYGCGRDPGLTACGRAFADGHRVSEAYVLDRRLRFCGRCNRSGLATHAAMKGAEVVTR
jgi:hypothetical protein